MSNRSNGIWNYEVRRLLAQGVSARVYAGFDKTKKVEVAIKMIEKKLIISQNLHNRVWKEIWIHIKLEHPSIVELYEVFEDSKYVYLILELCHKGQMQHYLDSHSKALTDDETRVVMHQIIDGLKYLHYHGIVHRDLTLANLLLTKDMNVKIADFGMATKLEDPNQQHDTLCGTPNFISLEIASGRPYRQETDLWSLGVILYTCLLRKNPFEANGVQATLKQMAQIKYELPDTLSPEARDLITKIFCEAGDRISLQGIKTHPFMRVKSSAAVMTKKVAGSGCGTVSSTKHRSSVSAPRRRTPPVSAFPLQQETHREEDRSHTLIGSDAGSTRSLTYFTHSSSANIHSHNSSAGDRNPPSPPVRERDSQSEEEIRRTRDAMGRIKFQSEQQNIHLAAHGEAKARPGMSWNKQFTAAKSGTSGAVEATTEQMHFHSLPPNDLQKVERHHQAFDPSWYKDPDCTSSYTNSAFRTVQHNKRTDKYGRSLCEAQQLQQASQIPSVYPENIQTQDLASRAYNFPAKDETQQRLRSSQQVELVYNKVPIQFASSEPASRNVKLTEQEIQHCLLEGNKTARKSDNKRDSKEVYSLPLPISTHGLNPLWNKRSI